MFLSKSLLQTVYIVYENLYKPMIYPVLTSCFNLPLLF
nr:MAG TPA: hypothetical protein [Caudoviricetes sp.]